MKKYMVLTVNDALEKKHYRLTADGELVYDFNASIDFTSPVFESYADITRFGDSKLTLTDDDGNEIPFKTADRFPMADEIKNHGFHRPAAHYTTSLGWTNDPNGLIYTGGRYHMFYQHNPHSVNWGNMTWGHAVSTDLVHWEEKGDILFPDKFGTMYSGSAYCDHDNAAGFGKDAILLFYTASGGENELSQKAGSRYSQCLAYSTDNGETFTKYDNNPIIPHIIGANRDPKVEWCDELGRYTLSLYLDGNEYAIFASDDLLHWEKLSDVHMPDDNECPDFYPLVIKDEETRKWVFSGAHDTYIVGTMGKDGFAPEQEALHYHIAPGVSYAAQTFSGCTDRRIKIAWGTNNSRGGIFNSQMGIPVEMLLRRVGDTIRLGSYPVSEVEKLVKETKNYSINGEIPEIFDNIKIGECAVDVTIAIKDGCAPFTVSVFGIDVFVDTAAGTYTHGDCTAPLTYSGDRSIRIIFDTLGAEIFADGGLVYSTFAKIADRSAGIQINCTDMQADLSVRTLSMM